MSETPPGTHVFVGPTLPIAEVEEVWPAAVCHPPAPRLREVGTTNKTRIDDYKRAIGPETAAILRVHPSNYAIVGFTESVPIDELVSLGQQHQIPVIDDIGSGALAENLPLPQAEEPTIADSIKAGADLVLCSGDKLLGGPQAGLLIGTKEAVKVIEADPMARALRVDKMTLAALEATLRLAIDPDRGRRQIPLWASASASVESLWERADRIAERLGASAGYLASPVRSRGFAGGGSVPGVELESAAVQIKPPLPQELLSLDDLAYRLRIGNPSIVGRVQQGAFWLDLRAVRPPDDAQIIARLVALTT